MNQSHKLLAKVGIVAAGAMSPMAALATVDNPFSTAAQNQYLDAVKGQSGLAGDGGSLPGMIGRIINIALSFLGIVLLFYLIYGGFKWMTAGGDSKGVDEAKTMIRNAIIGMVIIAASYAISAFVVTRLINVVGT